jgi:cyclohexanecarboxylate-CoA ligase
VNISPVPLEDTLAAHPNVHSVAVIGYPDERMGERICAVIVPAGEAPGLDALIAFVTEHGLAKQLWPERVHYVEDMPRTAAGKIRKLALRDAVVAASD